MFVGARWKAAEFITRRKWVCLILQQIVQAIFFHWPVHANLYLMIIGFIPWAAITYMFIFDDSLAAFRVLGFTVYRIEYDWITNMNASFGDRDKFFDPLIDAISKLSIRNYSKYYIVASSYFAFESQEDVNFLRLSLSEKMQRDYSFYASKYFFRTESKKKS